MIITLLIKGLLFCPLFNSRWTSWQGFLELGSAWKAVECGRSVKFVGEIHLPRYRFFHTGNSSSLATKNYTAIKTQDKMHDYYLVTVIEAAVSTRKIYDIKFKEARISEIGEKKLQVGQLTKNRIKSPV